ncbi:MAG: glycosyl transferase [Mucilaginibacter polytrichastri]|nr:glycosyl transferase [Mucilaginibacter polytrichastri]
MRIAHLILAHANPEQVAVLVDRLRHPDADIYIHLDRKSKMQPFAFLADQESVFFIRNRVDVRWGTYSCVTCTLNSIREIAAANKAYTTFNLLSGQDLPVKPIQEFHDFLREGEHANKAFMHSLNVETEWQEALQRLSYRDASYFYSGPFRYRISRIIDAVFTRKNPAGIRFYGRSQWFTITMEQAVFTLDFLARNTSLRRFFAFTWGADELVFQTVLENSPFKKEVVNDNLRYIDWSEGKSSPKVLNEDDLPAIQSSGAFFARKFDLKKNPEMSGILPTALYRS